MSNDRSFYDNWADGDYVENPSWQRYSETGAVTTAVVDRKSPHGGDNALQIGAGSGSDSAVTFGWAESESGWADQWALSGLFYSGDIHETGGARTHTIFAAYDPSTDSTALRIRLGFFDDDGNSIPFEIDGSAIFDGSQMTHDVDWQENTWYRYEITHDGSGLFKGRVWPATQPKPSAQASSIGTDVPSGERICGINVTTTGDAQFAVQHDFVGWVSGHEYVVEDFDHGTLETYLPDTAFAADTWDMVSAEEGSLAGGEGYYLRGHQADGSGHNPDIFAPSGLQYQPSRGDEISVYTRYNHGEHTPSFYFGVQDEWNGYEIIYDSRDRLNPHDPDTLVLRKWVDREKHRLAETSAPFSNHANEILRCQVEWGDVISVAFYDSTGGEITRVNAADDTFSAGGIAFGMRGHSGKEDVVEWDYVTAIPGSPSETVTGSATTLSLLPSSKHCINPPQGGESRDDRWDGDCEDTGKASSGSSDDRKRYHAHANAMPDYWGDTLDAWFIGDQTAELPDDLKMALDIRRSVPEYPGESFRQYRMKNRLRVSFSTEDNRTISDWSTVDVQTSRDDVDPYILVEGEPGEGNPLRELIDEAPDAEGEDVQRLFDEIEGSEKMRAESEVFPTESLPKSRSTNKVEINGVEGVRVSQIYGGKDTYARLLHEIYWAIELDTSIPGQGVHRFTELTDISKKAVLGFLVNTPTIFTFLDLVVLADGSTSARVWDASYYPRHNLYVNGVKRVQNRFEEGTGTVFDKGVGPVVEGDWVPRQHINLERFIPWVWQANTPVTPFDPYNPEVYEFMFDSSEFIDDHLDRIDYLPDLVPVMEYTQSGTELSKAEIESEIDEPLFPWE